MTASGWSRLHATLAGLFTVGLLSAGVTVFVSLPSGRPGPTSVTTMPPAPTTPVMPAAQTPAASQARPYAWQESTTATRKPAKKVTAPKPAASRSASRKPKARTTEPAPERTTTRVTRAATPRTSMSARPTRTSTTTASGSGMSGFETEVVRLTNAERSDAGCDALRPDSRLAEAADGHSADMAVRDYFSHTSPEGLTFVDRVRDAGYPSPGGENIAWGQRTPAEVVKDWMNSSGHRRNILNCDFNAIGVGFDSRGYYWTQVFGY
jgi:uncharacterized protein YkwD